MKVLVSDNISDKGISILEKAGLEVDVKTGLAPERLKKEIGKYDALIIRSATKVTADIIRSARKLRVIGRAGSGLDNVDKIAATKRGIVVMNTPGGNTITTAEHTVALLLSMARQIPQATASMKQGKWEKKKFMGVELYHKTLGIIGLGNIGTHVARMAQGMGMNVITYDPYLSEEKAKTLGVTVVELNGLFKNADFITNHIPLTNETKNLINARSIAKMKKGVRIINAARGGVIDEEALYKALKSGRVAAAALDVFEKEPPEGSPLLELDNFICTPHLGASTADAQENVAVAVANQIVEYLLHGTIRNAVNFPSVSADVFPVLQPYINLAERLGSFISQNFDGGIDEIIIEYKGTITELNLEPVTIAVLKGILTPILEETVNFINAPLIAKERGIEVKEITTDDAGDYQSMMVVKIKSGKKESSVSGILHGKREPRIISVNGFTVEIIPEGEMLVLSNIDKPGVIGDLGTLLGKNNINISKMHFGRAIQGGKAISVVSVDIAVPKTILFKIRKLPNVLSVKQIHLPV
ncbi:MAG TPA: phosphoglycerate dehydrogenase [Nitrospirae bacterium]|nr:D-3-phosphoglycerate dehydrogenase [bacterium BMS3Abin06]HDH11513.1 phosphoglycerate dehydrogenase [Nitrospirota bacterium]HDZ00468.1 phosphoglycerate dehydrogenase [Nitrospirota bacterium]